MRRPATCPLGIDCDGTLKTDEEWRKRKAELLKEFVNDLEQFAKRAAYLSGSDQDFNRRLEQALEAARKAIGQATEDLHWTEPLKLEPIDQELAVMYRWRST